MTERKLGPNHEGAPEGIDEAIADRLLAGELAADDAPQGFQEVARTLQAAALSAQQAPATSAGPAIAAFHAARPQRRIQRMKKWQLAAATLAGGLTLSTGLAAADVLPGAAQDVASEALAKVGISVPDNSNDHADTRGKSADNKGGSAEDDDTTDVSTDTSKPENHGSVVSNVARDDSTSGAEHGTAVCTAASEGKCQTGGASTRSGSGPNANSTEGSANAGQSSGNSTEGATNSGQGSANAGQSSGNSNTTTSGSGDSSSTQSGGSTSSGSTSGSNVSSGSGG